MARPPVLAVAILGVALVVVACDGSSSPAASDGSSPSPAASAAASTAASSPSPSAAGASTQPSTGPGGAAAACDLITANEAAGVLGVPIASTSGQPGEPSYCQYVGSDGAWHAATSLTHDASPITWDTFADEAGAIVLDVPGAEAVFSPSTETVIVRKGTTMLGITAGVGAGVTPTEERMRMGTELAVIAVSRL